MRRIVLAFLLVFPALSQDTGQRQYEARCAGCHGADGNGGGHGRGIVGSQRDRDAVREIILKGIPAAGMPAFAIPSAEAEAIAT
jgi:mono/diheme cytochrome c family protein